MMTWKKAWMAGVVLACGNMLWGQAASQPAAVPAFAEKAVTANAPAAEPVDAGVGVVTGDNVYVRSGFSKHYYPVIKLHKGDKVNILRSEYGWLEITPPAGTFSLIEKSRVDRTGESTGVVNDLAQVYAGSDLDSSHYAKQVKLQKGDQVRIVGETAEGDFYKIAPPPGATLWISADFVKRGAAAAAAESTIEPVKAGELSKAQRDVAAGGKKATIVEPVKKTPVAAAPPVPKPDPALTQAYRDRIRALEAEIADELRKPPADQNIEPIVGKLNELLNQKEDITAQVYAKARIRDMEDQMALAAAVVEMKQLREETELKADEIARRRAEQRARESEFKIDEIAARGEIRVSGLYDGSGGRAKRWRLVDPKTSRTIAYFELAPGCNVDPVQYYGKYVGVKATSYQLLHGTVPPLPVYVVTSIELQDPNKPSSRDIVRKDALASPEPRLVDAPASQPSVSPAPATQPTAR